MRGSSHCVSQGGKGGKIGAIDEFRHTTDAYEAPNMQSVIENNDLTELLTMVGEQLSIDQCCFVLVQTMQVCSSSAGNGFPVCNLLYEMMFT